MRHRDRLPQLEGEEPFLTDGGIETVLIFHEGHELPLFAAFDLLKDEAGTEALARYYEPYLALAGERGLGFVLETPTWRASSRWAAELGYDAAALERANRDAVALAERVAAAAGAGAGPIVISGCIGPHEDGYDPAEQLSAEEAEEYHRAQIGTFADAGADMVSAITMTYAEEAIGIARAAADAGVPAAISFTVETDGRLPDGQALADAIGEVDGAAEAPPAYYMINCAHPTHFESVLDPRAEWAQRIRGLRANASRMSHAELDEAEELDDGDPEELGAQYAALLAALPELTVFGGCCGTDHRHVARIRDAVLAAT